MGTALLGENISKQYRLGQVGTGTLSHDLKRALYKLRGKEDPFKKIGVSNDRSSSKAADYVWALKDVNFNIKQGDMVGVIGKNGAGKSTLLKLLSRVTAPTTGSIKINGRIAALLEVGTGFHPELTGRENVFLNGAILGMSKVEIASKFDEIVAFSGCEMYIDTPVKRYSSGMIVRLGFAVAAHLEPEILIVDEVLAVGDAEFQDKCIGKMRDICGEGRTVLFVSHNMATMKSLCKRGFLMDQGRMVNEGSMGDMIEHYLESTTKSSFDGLIPENSSTINSGELFYKKINIKNFKDENVDKVNYMSDINLELSLESLVEMDDVLLDVRINSKDGVKLVHCMNKYNSTEKYQIIKGQNTIKVKIGNQLQPGNYCITIGVHKLSGLTMEFVEDIMDFKVLKIGEGDNAGFTHDFKLGYVHLNSKWEINN